MVDCQSTRFANSVFYPKRLRSVIVPHEYTTIKDKRVFYCHLHKKIMDAERGIGHNTNVLYEVQKRSIFRQKRR